MKPLLSACVIEGIGSFALVFLGCGILTLLKQLRHPATDLAAAIIFATVVALAIVTLRSYSGAHFNPAVTVGLATMGQFSWTMVPSYCAAQILGGCLAGVALRLLIWMLI